MARAALIGLSLAAVTAWSCITHLAAGGASGTGVGIQAGNVCLAAPARPGGSYQPGTVYVSNAGSGTEVISLRAGPMPSGGHARPVPPAWVTFSYPALSLAPSQGAGVPVTLNIPASARPGQYEAALTASAGGTPASGGGTQAVLGAAAITFLKFSVGAAPAGCNPPPPSQAGKTPQPGRKQ